MQPGRTYKIFITVMFILTLVMSGISHAKTDKSFYNNQKNEKSLNKKTKNKPVTKAKKAPSHSTASLIHKVINVKKSLSEAAQKQKVPKKILTDATNILDSRGIKNFKKGDELEVFYRAILEPKKSIYDLQYVKAKTKEKEVALYRFTNKDGQTKFYDRTGKADPIPFFIKPVNGGRISSGWGWRTHPVLGGKRFHKGIDFALPQGSKVMATADGVIEDMGWRDNYGYYMRIRHNKVYKTAYAHLNDFANNLDEGDKVSQGQVIGYVGETGLATGPHLYYEVIKSGFHINPLAVKEVKYATISSKEKGKLSNFITLINNEIKAQKLASSEDKPKKRHSS